MARIEQSKQLNERKSNGVIVYNLSVEWKVSSEWNDSFFFLVRMATYDAVFFSFGSGKQNAPNHLLVAKLWVNVDATHGKCV